MSRRDSENAWCRGVRQSLTQRHPKFFRCGFLAESGVRFALWRWDTAMAKLELVKLDLGEGGDGDAGDSKSAPRRYEHDAYAQKLIRETGRRAARRFFQMVDNDAFWEGLSPRVQAKLIEMALDRAYGKVETVTAEEKSAAGQQGEIAGALPSHLRALAGSLTLPEMAKASRAKE